MSEDQFNLRVCPECKKKHYKDLRYEDDCGNPDCECYITKEPETGKLLWWNPNWDLPNENKEEE